MESQLRQIGKRIEETRKVLEIPVAEMAQITGISQEEYLAHERGEVDHSFTFIYHCAERFGIDISALVTGSTPNLSVYDVTRRGNGMPIKRRKELEYKHLAPQLKTRQVYPLMVTAKLQDENAPIALTTHSGHEFDYVLKGTLKVQIGEKTEILEEGDSVTFDSSLPHGMVAVGDHDCEFLAIVNRGEHEFDVPTPVAEKEVPDTE